MEAVRPIRVKLWRRIAPIVVVSVFYYGVLVYPVLRILGLALPEWQPGTWELLAIMVGPLAGRLAYEAVPCNATRWLSALALTWLGICFVAFTLVLGWEVANLLLPLPGRESGWLLMALTGFACMVGYANAQRVAVRTIQIPAPQIGKRIRIAQISDVHVGSRSGRFLRRVVKRTNTQNPDLVVITGDLVDFRDISQQELASLSELEAPTYFVIGNHERYVDCEAICERLTNLGIHVMRDETLELAGIQLIGIDDAEPRTQVGKVLQTLRPDPHRYRILLYHRPDGARDAAAWGAHLMLCGHTHAGQIVPFNLLVKRVFPRIRGIYRVDGLTLYVSPGTGTWGPILRLGSRSEISIMSLG